jgi:hypothetical protein
MDATIGAPSSDRLYIPVINRRQGLFELTLNGRLPGLSGKTMVSTAAIRNSQRDLWSIIIHHERLLSYGRLTMVSGG